MVSVDAIIGRVARFIEREQLLRGVKRLVLAVSGGPDSLALTVAFKELAPRYGVDLVVAHFNHRLRPESEAELEYVRRIAQSLGLRCVTGEGDVAQRARESKRGIEDVARELRYQFLAFVAQRERAEGVAIGHTSDDHVETVLLHLLRGAGIRGLRGIAPKGPLPWAPALRVLRPLLVLSRADTLALCERAGLEPLYDPSNEGLRFTRNRIRHQLLPALREFNPAIERALVTLSRSADEAFQLLEREALRAQPAERTPTAVVFALEALRKLPGEALLLVLEREAAYLRRRFEANSTRIENARQVLLRGSGEVCFGELVFEASCGQVRLGPPVEPIHVEERLLEVPGITRLGDLRVIVRTSPSEGDWLSLDRTRARGALRARSLRPGDRILVRGVRRKVTDWLTEQRVPRWVRRRVVVVTDGSEALALLGCGLPPSTPPDAADLLYLRLEEATS